jgi:hypothetical protein
MGPHFFPAHRPPRSRSARPAEASRAWPKIVSYETELSREQLALNQQFSRKSMRYPLNDCNTLKTLRVYGRYQILIVSQ